MREFYDEPWDLSRPWTWRDTAVTAALTVACYLAIAAGNVVYYLIVLPWRYAKKAAARRRRPS